MWYAHKKILLHYKAGENVLTSKYRKFEKMITSKITKKKLQLRLNVKLNIFLKNPIYLSYTLKKI